MGASRGIPTGTWALITAGSLEHWGEEVMRGIF